MPTPVAGDPLYGFKLVTLPTEEAEGEDSFPVIRLFIPGVVEEPRNVAHVVVTVAVRMTISTRRSLGIAELAAKTDAMLDAIETEHGGGLDLTFGGILARPMEFAYGSAFSTTLSMTNEVTVSMMLRPRDRGSRST